MGLKISSAAVLLAAMLVLLGGCSREKTRPMRAPAEGGTLVFAATLGGPPYTYADPVTGEPTGIDIDLAKAAAERLGQKLEIRIMEFSELIPSVKAGAVDFAGAAITITPNRARDVDFSTSYAQDGSAFLMRADRPPVTIVNAVSSRVATQAGSVSFFYLCDHWVDPICYPTFEEALSDFEKGKLDAVFYDAEPIRHTVAESKGAYAASPLETREHYGLAIRKDFPELKAAVNAVVAERKGNPR